MGKEKPHNHRNYLKLLAKSLLCLPRGIRNCGEDVYISPFTEIKNPGKIFLGKGAVLERHSRLYANGENAQIKIGEYTTIYPYVLLKTNGGKIEIGKGCSVNDYSILYGYGGITIGDDVHIAGHTVIIASEHDYNKLGNSSFSQDILAKGVKIESHVWIGANAVILDGATIGRGSVIGAGAVVTKDIPPDSIAVGVPARVIKKRI
jgi:acetyltransferase-like isoleucine patch superfamily enzyme